MLEYVHMKNMILNIISFFSELRVSKKTLTIVFIGLFVISLLPLYVTAFYAMPVYDDYNFGITSHIYYIQGKSFILGAIYQAIDKYFNWQGFYLSSFWAAIQPFNININLYFISCWIAITSLVFSVFYFSKSVLMNVFSVSKWDYLLITIPIVEVIIQFLPSPAEGFYWMDGSLSLVFQSIQLCVFASVINYHFSQKRKSLYAIISVLGVLAVCGDYPHLYVTLIYCFGLVLTYMIPKKYRTSRLMILLMALNTLVIVVSLIAPGNTVRMTSLERISMPVAFFYAIFYGFVKMGFWLYISLLAVLVFVGYIFYPYVQKSKYSFSHPIIFAILCYGAYTCRMFVSMYSGGSLGSPRQYNLYYLSFVIVITATVFYFIGWIAKNNPEICIKNHKSISLGFLTFIFLFICTGFLQFGVKRMVSVDTTLSLLNGKTQQYHSEMMERVEKYTDNSGRDVVVSPLSFYPDFFMQESISDDSMYWTNRSVAKYYDKDSVRLSKE